MMRGKSLSQRESSARAMLRNAIAQGLDDDAAIAFAVAALGSDDAGVVARVWGREFVVRGPV